MRVLDPGHLYSLDVLDLPVYPSGEVLHAPVHLQFVKREGDGYPGNVGTNSGTITQEVLRVLIDRTIYVNNQIPHVANDDVLHHLRKALIALEYRASDRRGESIRLDMNEMAFPEQIPTCPTCGHIRCSKHA